MSNRYVRDITDTEIAKLNELYLAGVSVAEMGEILRISEGYTYELIRKERAKNPEKWPVRERKRKKSFWEIPKPKTILQATYPRLQLQSSPSGPVTTRQMTAEEILKYGPYIPPRDSNGEIIKAPVNLKIPSNGQASK